MNALEVPLLRGGFWPSGRRCSKASPALPLSGARPLCRAVAWLAVVRVARFLREVKELVHHSMHLMERRVHCKM